MKKLYLIFLVLLMANCCCEPTYHEGIYEVTTKQFSTKFAGDYFIVSCRLIEGDGHLSIWVDDKSFFATVREGERWFLQYAYDCETSSYPFEIQRYQRMK